MSKVESKAAKVPQKARACEKALKVDTLSRVQGHQPAYSFPCKLRLPMLPPPRPSPILQALSVTYPSYQLTRQRAPRLGMIFDHLEDAVFAPDSSCLWCTDSLCDGTNCAFAFEPNDFHEATVLLMQQLQPLVANAKLDRPIDNNPPLSHELMLYLQRFFAH
jgi:hypothetical protein